MSTPPTSLAGLPPFRLDPRAVCRDGDPDRFFPDMRGSAKARAVARAKADCRACPLRVECLGWALDTKQIGIWGGTTDDERRAIASRPGRPSRAWRPETRAAA